MLPFLPHFNNFLQAFLSVMILIHWDLQWRIQRGGGGGGEGGGGHRGHVPPRPPFRSSNYTFIVAQYSVLNSILNVQLSKASALRAGGDISPSRTHPLSVNHAHFLLNFNFLLLVPAPPPPPPPPFKIPGSALDL